MQERREKRDRLERERNTLHELEEELLHALASYSAGPVKVELTWDLSGNSMRSDVRNFEILCDGEPLAVVSKAKHKHIIELPVRHQRFVLNLRPAVVRGGTQG